MTRRFLRSRDLPPQPSFSDRWGLAVGLASGALGFAIAPVMPFVPTTVVFWLGAAISFGVLVIFAPDQRGLLRNRHTFRIAACAVWIMIWLAGMIGTARSAAHDTECANLQARMLSPQGGERETAIHQAMSCKTQFTSGLNPRWAR